MRPEELAARVLGTRQILSRHFGDGVEIEVITPTTPVLPPSDRSESEKFASRWREVIPTRPEPVPGEYAPPVAAVPDNSELDDVRILLGDCMRCTLCYTRTNMVFGVGNPHADLVIIGEAPGQDEDKQGEPFVGKSGAMLDRMLANVIDLARDEVYILNVLKCRPPSNRNPTEGEIESCMPFLERQLQAIDPKLILVLGAFALRTLFPETKGGIARNRGTWMTYRGIEVMPTFHPAYLLRKKRDKKQLTFQDLQALKTRYDELMTM